MLETGAKQSKFEKLFGSNSVSHLESYQRLQSGALTTESSFRDGNTSSQQDLDLTTTLKKLKKIRG
jgi:hypothetical protein